MGRPSLAEPRRRQIIDGLRSALVRHGLAGASVQRIAAEAGLPAGLVHHYFDSKEALLIATVDQVVDEVRGPLMAELDVLDPERAVARALDVLYLEVPAERARSVLLEEIAVAALRRPQLRRRLAELNAETVRDLALLLDRLPDRRDRLPDRRGRLADRRGRLADRRGRRAENADLAFLLVCLAFGADGQLLFDPDVINLRRLRRIADELVARYRGAHDGKADAHAPENDRRLRGHRVRRRAGDRRAARAH